MKNAEQIKREYEFVKLMKIGHIMLKRNTKIFKILKETALLVDPINYACSKKDVTSLVAEVSMFENAIDTAKKLSKKNL